MIRALFAPTLRPSPALQWIAVVTIELLAGIHIALAPMHLDEKFYIGVLFIIGSAVLVGVGLLLAAAPRQPFGWLLGAAVSIVMLILYLISRTTGLPDGYQETWASNSEDVLGLLSLAADLVFLAGVTAALWRPGYRTNSVAHLRLPTDSTMHFHGMV